MRIRIASMLSQLLIAIPFLISSLFGQVAILEFEALGLAKENASVFSSHFEAEFFRLNRYEIVERQKIESLIEEYKLQLSGLTETEKAVKLGMLLNAQYVVTGSVNRVDGIFSATAKMISVENGRIHSVANIYGQINFNDLLMKGTNSLAAQLSGLPAPDLSVVKGEVVAKPNSRSPLKTKIFAKYVIGQTLASDSRIYGTKGFAFGLDFGKGSLGFEHTEDKFNNGDGDELKRETNIIAFDVGYEVFRVFFGFGPRTQYNYYFEEDQSNMTFKAAFSLNFSSRWVGVEPVLGYTMGNEKLDWYWGVNLGLYPYQW